MFIYLINLKANCDIVPIQISVNRQYILELNLRNDYNRIGVIANYVNPPESLREVADLFVFFDLYPKKDKYNPAVLSKMLRSVIPEGPLLSRSFPQYTLEDRTRLYPGHIVFEQTLPGIPSKYPGREEFLRITSVRFYPNKISALQRTSSIKVPGRV